MKGVGSTAVREAILEYQPLLSLHGHIHESRGMQRLGQTICINPGSTYGDWRCRESSSIWTAPRSAVHVDVGVKIGAH